MTRYDSFGYVGENRKKTLKEYVVKQPAEPEVEMEFIGHVATFFHCLLLCLRYFPEGNPRHKACEGVEFDRSECYIPTTSGPSMSVIADPSSERNHLLVTFDLMAQPDEIIPIGLDQKEACTVNASVPPQELRANVLVPGLTAIGGFVNQTGLGCLGKACYDIGIGEKVAELMELRLGSACSTISINDGTKEVLWITGGTFNSFPGPGSFPGPPQDSFAGSGLPGGAQDSFPGILGPPVDSQNDQHLISTEFVSPGEPTQEGPDIDGKFADHCMVAVNDSAVMIIGGKLSRNVLLFNSIRNVVALQPSVKVKLHGSACGSTTITDGNRKLIIIAGGENDNFLAQSTVEILDMSDEDPAWKLGPELTFRSDYASGITTKDGRFLMVGGSEQVNNQFPGALFISNPGDQIYELSCPSGAKTIDNCQWILRKEKFALQRTDFFAMMVPESFYTC